MDNETRREARIFAQEAASEVSADIDTMMRNMAEDANALYIQAANKAAVMARTQGMEKALREAVTEVAEKGVSAYSYQTKNGSTVHVPVDVGIRRAMNDAMRERKREQTLGIAARVGVDLVAVSTTANARKSHAEWQGKVYSISGATPGYEKFEDACRVGDPVNGIGGYNCGHEIRLHYENTKSDFPDPLEGTGYTTEEARELTSKQRALERDIRKQKRIREVLKETGYDTRDVSRKIRGLTSELKTLIDRHSTILHRQQSYRETIAPTLRKRVGASGVVHIDTVSKEKIENLRWAKLQRNEWAKRNLGLNVSKQNRHIRGTEQYEAKLKQVLSGGVYAEQSYLTISAEKCEELIKRYAGKGIVGFGNDWLWDKTEICKAPFIIGYVVDRITDDGEPGEHHKTRYFKIHYSEKGLHIVPFNRSSL